LQARGGQHAEATHIGDDLIDRGEPLGQGIDVEALRVGLGPGERARPRLDLRLGEDLHEDRTVASGSVGAAFFVSFGRGLHRPGAHGHKPGGLAVHALDLGAMTPFFYVWQQREYILDMFEMFSGVRMMPSWIVPGGLRGDMPDGFEPKLREFLKNFPAELKQVEDLLVENPIWKERTFDVGILTGKECLELGCSGPIARASGVAFDLRKSNPYSSYEDFDFQIPVGSRGDVYDRFLVRIAEMKESVKILQQAIDGLPGGAWSTADRKITPPPRAELDSSMESLIHHFKLWTEGYRPPVGEAYAAIEGSKGELGFYVVSDGSNRPYRWHERPSSFMNLKSLEVLAKGRLLSDLIAIIGSIDIVLGEIDR